MESSKPLPNAVKASHDKISQLYNSNKTLANGPADVQDLGRILGKMFGKSDRSNIEATMDHMF